MPFHAVVNMLDPKHVGQQTLAREQINGAYHVISNLLYHLHLDEGKVLCQILRQAGIMEGCGDMKLMPTRVRVHVVERAVFFGAAVCRGLSYTPDPVSNRCLRATTVWMCFFAKQRHNGSFLADGCKTWSQFRLISTFKIQVIVSML